MTKDENVGTRLSGEHQPKPFFCFCSNPCRKPKKNKQKKIQGNPRIKNVGSWFRIPFQGQHAESAYGSC